MSSSHDNLATLASVPTEVEAQMLVNLLNEHGVTAVATGALTSQFRAEAPGVVRVLIKQESLPDARSVLADRGLDRHAAEPGDEDTESLGYVPKSSRLAIRGALILSLLLIAGDLVGWGLGGNVTGGVVASVVSLIIVAAILTRRRFRRL